MPDASLRTASLPMYDFPATEQASSRFWQALRVGPLERDSGADDVRLLPEHLLRTSDAAIPLSGARPPEPSRTCAEVIYNQTCGYPCITHLREHVTLIGTPDYGLISGRAGWYDSDVVVRVDDPHDRLEQFENTRFVFNERDSQSGLHAMMYLLHCPSGHRSPGY